MEEAEEEESKIVGLLLSLLCSRKKRDKNE